MDEDHLLDLFASLADVSVRRMFGGQGIYSEGLIVAVVLDGELHLKSHPSTEAVYEAAGCDRWRYERPGRSPVAMPYYRLPDTALEEPDEMARWAARAMESARLSQKPPARRKPKSGRARRRLPTS